MTILDRPIAFGSYTGNGSSQSISIGWEPSFVWTFTEDSVGGADGRATCWIVSGGGGTAVWYTGRNTWETSNHITLTSTGFDLGGDKDVNQNNTVHHWIAFRKDHPAFALQQYTGDTNPTITVTSPWEIDWRIATYYVEASHPSASEGAGLEINWRELQEGGSGHGEVTFSSSSISSGPNPSTNFGLVAINPTSYEAENSDANVTHYDLIGRHIAGETRHSEGGEYVGDNAASRDIALGYQPSFVILASWLISDPDAASQKAFKTATMPGNDGAYGSATAPTIDYDTNLGITITSTGFTVETGGVENWNNSTKTYQWLAFRDSLV